jgi:hypothetical protein
MLTLRNAATYATDAPTTRSGRGRTTPRADRRTNRRSTRTVATLVDPTPTDVVPPWY